MNNVVLYILMRTDLASMTPGRACAQASHAANACILDMKSEGDADTMGLVNEWEAEANGFGTAIVLSATYEDLINLAELSGTFETNDVVWAGIVHDPEYAVKDGQVTHLIPLDTCAYLFGRKDDCSQMVSHLSLF